MAKKIPILKSWLPVLSVFVNGTIFKKLLLFPLKNKNVTMIRSAIMFLIVALIAGVAGFGIIAGSAAVIAQTVFYISTVMLLVSLLSVPAQQQPTGSLDQ